jgi:hypothetical protein
MRMIIGAFHRGCWRLPIDRPPLSLSVTNGPDASVRYPPLRAAIRPPAGSHPRRPNEAICARPAQPAGIRLCRIARVDSAHDHAVTCMPIRVRGVERPMAFAAAAGSTGGVGGRRRGAAPVTTRICRECRIEPLLKRSLRARRMRSAPPTLDPPTTRQVPAPTWTAEGTRCRGVPRPIRRGTTSRHGQIGPRAECRTTAAPTAGPYPAAA